MVWPSNGQVDEVNPAVERVVEGLEEPIGGGGLSMVKGKVRVRVMTGTRARARTRARAWLHASRNPGDRCLRLGGEG